MKHAIIIGLFTLPVGILIGIHVRLTAAGDGYQHIPYYTGPAAFLTTYLLWYFIVEKRGSYTALSGIIAGSLSGFFAHYVAWYMMILSCNLQYLLWGGCTGSLNDPPVNPLYGLLTGFLLSFFSLLFYGWITVPAGGLIGYLYIKYLQK